MRDGFYRAFEDKYRGRRSEIKSRLKVYLPFVLPLKEFYPEQKVLDLGCGRGEWLELLKEKGFCAKGVDIDEGMLQYCRKKNLEVLKSHAVSVLEKTPSGSLVLVSAFHLVEHVPFDDLRALVSEALRVLKPGGLLIMETPNPENIVVGTSSFYLDPTHQSPIPPLLLAFVPESEGFERVKTLRLQEAQELMRNKKPTLKDVFYGVSPDYAVIAQKKAPENILSRFDEVFAREHGLTLEMLTGRYESRISQIETRATQAEDMARQALEGLSRIETRCLKAEQQLNAVYISRSWRITMPLRYIGEKARWIRQGGIAWLTFAPRSRPRRTLHRFMLYIAGCILARPLLERVVCKIITPFPRVKSRLLAIGDEYISSKSPDCASSRHKMCASENTPELSGSLSPRALRIYHALKTAFEQQRKDRN